MESAEQFQRKYFIIWHVSMTETLPRFRDQPSLQLMFLAETQTVQKIDFEISSCLNVFVRNWFLISMRQKIEKDNNEIFLSCCFAFLPATDRLR
jgi:hypothetical protein